MIVLFYLLYLVTGDSFSQETLVAQDNPTQEVVNLEDLKMPSTSSEATATNTAPVESSNGAATEMKSKENSDSYQFFKGQTTSIRNPFELRDPFKRENQRNKSGKKIKYGGVVEGTSFTNLPSIANVPIERIKITGVLIGKDRRAMAKIEGDENTYVLKEGMTLGVDGAEIKAILPGGIVLVEKIRNIYDQDEYLETILTIAQE